MDDPTALAILSLDGGGVRGLSSLLILRSLMDQLKTVSNLDTTPKPCEVFDLICGTSTGGLIALMLGRLRMSVEDAIQCYLDFSERIFKDKGFLPSIRQLFGSPVYDASILAECVKQIVAQHGDASDGGNTTLKDPLDGKGGFCRTFVVAVSSSFADSPPKRFRSYATTSQSASECKIWEAARATTAASTFFDPITMGSPPETFIDGAFSGANNPSQIALDEVDRVFPNRPIGCFLSLGTGVPKVVAVKGHLAKIAEACAKLLTNCEMVADNVNKEFRKKFPDEKGNPYFRFSVDRGLETITLDEWKRVEELSAITGGYMRFDTQERKVEKCVKALAGRAVGPSLGL